MKYLILEKGEGYGCDYTIGCNQRWKVVESDLPYEEFKNRCVKYALFGGDADANWEDYSEISDEQSVVELHILQISDISTVDLDEEKDYYRKLFNERLQEILREEKIREYHKLKSELNL